MTAMGVEQQLDLHVEEVPRANDVSVLGNIEGHTTAFFRSTGGRGGPMGKRDDPATDWEENVVGRLSLDRIPLSFFSSKA
jgi:hypothetical protein